MLLAIGVAIVLFALGTAAAIVAVVWPLHRTAKSVCQMIAERNPLDRFASPNRGAVVTLRGTLYGGPEGMYLLQTPCPRGDSGVAIEVSRYAVAGPWTRHTLHAITNPQWTAVDRSAPVRMVGRVESEAESCFGPGMIVRALWIETTGPVTVRPHPREAF
jgi:hypothetical protein